MAIDKSTTAFLIKISTGIIILPLSVLMIHAWPWWQKTNWFNKAITGIILIPIAGFLYLVTPWWNSL